MAHNPNYFGFAHGGTQYTGQPAPYPTAQAAYVQAAAPQAAYATATAPRAQSAYDTYQTAATAGAYAYATTRAPTATYDATKAYYQPAPAATYTVQEAAYQTAAAAAKPVYAATAYQAPAAATRQIAAQKPTVHVTQANYSYTPVASHQTSNATYSTNTYTPASTTGSAGSAQGGAQGNSMKLHGYDAALYSAATSYYQQQQGSTNKMPLATNTTTNWFKKSTAFVKKDRPKLPPKQPQLHYCDVCKISCAGPQTYREHLEGQKHKKKEAGQPAPAGRAAQNQLRCELCDVACTGSDAYAAHIRGAKHKKVLKLHTKLGKTIPSTEPVVITAPSTATASAPKTGATATTKVGAKPIASTTGPAAGAIKKVMATPKINFLGGTQLKTAGAKVEEVKVDSSVKAESVDSEAQSQDSDGPLLPGEKDIQPVGHEYIEEVKNEVGKVVSFNCKLCECKFNDPNAKEMHMKGRRHRLQYKKKVDPKLVVEVKPGIRMRKIQEDRMKRNMQREEYMKRRQDEERMMMEEEQHYWDERRRFEAEMMQRQPSFGPMGMRRPDTLDDRHVMHKHHNIYPKENELQGVQAIVTACEKALKLVSDHIAECDNPVKDEVKKDEVKKDEVKKDVTEGKEPEKEDPPQRALKGVMRVGVLAKGLLLTGCLNINLVVLCQDKPTRSLLDRVADALPQKLETINDEKYEVRRCVEEAAIIVSSDKEPQATCTVTLTSPVMREPTAAEADVKDPPDVLDRQKCLDALASLRHAKWFQARANGLQSCVVVIRIMRDLGQRVPTWAPLSEWAMELLVEKCISSSSVPLAPGDALRRVFECLASGILMPGGPGLWDPCEKEPKDAAGNLTSQAREDITASAQHALRLVSFRQIHKVLGMDPLPSMRFQRPRFNPRKRRRTTSTGETTEADATEGKKDRKEGETEVKKEETST